MENSPKCTQSTYNNPRFGDPYGCDIRSQDFRRNNTFPFKRKTLVLLAVYQQLPEVGNPDRSSPPPYFMGETGPFSTNLNWVASQLALEPVDFRPHTLLPTSSVLMGKCCRHLYPCVDKKFQSISGPIKLSYVHVFLCMKNVQNQLNSNMDPFCIYIAIFSSAARERIDFSPDGPELCPISAYEVTKRKGLYRLIRSPREYGASCRNGVKPQKYSTLSEEDRVVQHELKLRRWAII